MPKLPDVRKAYIDRMELRKEQLKSLPFHGKTCQWMCFGEEVAINLIKRARDLGMADDVAGLAIFLIAKRGLNHFGMVPRTEFAAIASRKYRARIEELFVPHPADPENYVTLPEFENVIAYTASQYGFGSDGKPLSNDVVSTKESPAEHSGCTTNHEIPQNQAILSGQKRDIRIEELEKEPTTPSLRSGVVARPTDLFGDADAQNRFREAVIKPKPERKKPDRHQMFESWVPDFDLIAYAESIRLDPIAAKRGLSRFRDNHIGRRARLASSWNEELKLWLQQDANRATGGKVSPRVKPKIASGQSDKREQELQFIQSLPEQEKGNAFAAWRAKWTALGHAAENLTADGQSDVSATHAYPDPVSPASDDLCGSGVHAGGLGCQR